jgi:nitrogen fixation/metabolism regulation signal transduction histidine kinase
VRNPLTPIAVSVADLKRSYEQRRPDFAQVLDQAVRTIGDEIEALKRMLAEFSELGRFPEPVLGPCALAELIADLEALYAGDVADGRVAFARPPAGAVVRADREQLRQALVNLVKNGLEAIAPGGHVEVSAVIEGQAAVIAVADDGEGLDRASLARLFEPRFTTKPHGSGLGLTIVHRIVNDHGGTIVVDSAVGRGTTFRIRLPLATQGER